MQHRVEGHDGRTRGRRLQSVRTNPCTGGVAEGTVEGVPTSLRELTLAARVGDGIHDGTERGQ